MSEDRMDAMAEIEAMRVIAEALGPLDEEAAGRVLRWAAERFGRAGPAPNAMTARAAADSDASDPTLIEDLAELFSRAAPETEMERALVVGYWLQVIQGEPEFDSQRVNSELKHLGYPVGNITRAFENLKPTLVQQTKKTGTTRQARKRYKVTHEGRRQVERMVGRPAA